MMKKLLALCVLVKLVLNVDAAEFQPVHIAETKKECYGTHNRFSRMGDLRHHYDSIRRIYGDCTYVHGNLEITHLHDPDIDYDLEFLSKIEVVTGYVLIALVRDIDKIPLTSLKLIKGQRPLVDDHDGLSYGLMVVVTRASELQLPALREISNGGVKLFNNPHMCHLTTIVWQEVTSEGAPLMLSLNARGCRCSDRCTGRTGRRHCWGNSDTMCQQVDPIRRQRCDTTCPGSRCHIEGILGPVECCHSQCAVGCFGPLDTQCLMCKVYKYGHQCVTECPEKTYSYAGYCVPF